MSNSATSETTPHDPNAPTQSQLAFQRQTDALAHHLVGLCITTGVPPIMAALASSQIIRAVIMDLQKTNPAIAKAVLEELATGLVELCSEIDVEPDISSEGKTKQ